MSRVCLRGPCPSGCPVSCYRLSLGLPFQVSIWWFLRWSWLLNMLDVAKPVHLAAQPLQGPGSLSPLSAAPGYLSTPGEWGLIGAEGQHGHCKCCLGQSPSPHPVQAYSITWHLRPPAGSREPLAGGTVPAWQMGLCVSCQGPSARLRTGLQFGRAGHFLLRSSS